MSSFILGVSGKRGAGKDTLYQGLYDVLSESRAFARYIDVRRISFADPLREIVISSFKAERVLAYGDDKQKDTPLPTAPDVTIREAMRTIGKAFTRVEPTFFTRRAKEQILTIRRYTNESVPQLLVITDVRFPHEMEMIRGFGGKVIRLMRAPHPTDAHYTETALDHATFDAIIDNRSLPAMAVLADTINLLQTWGWYKGLWKGEDL